ncbi:phosphotransferase [Streptomyces sp. NBC_01142]|uniref:phosphotransferase n=1 Tax=Streptomyces sp. NBC_01142 TaxID=2975865 RepID=UPI002257E7A2|nr:phosphotransferase [Streptomyces sp. NBC_01142]MCX4825783.1 phosphotransferase [Streptomyces sp. NBC_01142]
MIPAVHSHAGPAGAHVPTPRDAARDSDGRRWFVKAYPTSADLGGEPQAPAPRDFARSGGVPVPAVRRTLAGDLIATVGGMAVSVAAYVEGAETAEGGLSGNRWAAMGEVVGRLHRTLARHPAGPSRRVPAHEICDVKRARRATVTPAVEAYGRTRHSAMSVLYERLEEAGVVLHDLLH